MMDAFVAMPDGGGTHPGLIVIHEMYGLNDNIRDIATRFADEGYAVMAPNLYSRVGGAVRFCMTQLFKAFIKMKMDQRAVRDLRGAVVHLQSMNGVNWDRVGVVGFCMGGGFSLLLACAYNQVNTSVVFYGRNPSPIDLVAGLNCPLLFMYGEDDKMIAKGVPKLRSALESNGKSFETHSYPGTGHSFMNDARGSFRPDTASDAWKRTIAFLDATLNDDN
jgi:carboxymethylenebutenolidase